VLKFVPGLRAGRSRKLAEVLDANDPRDLYCALCRTGAAAALVPRI
jgi:hypothetical protein